MSQNQNEYSPVDVYKMQRTERGLDFERKMKKFETLRKTGDAETREIVKSVNDHLRSLKDRARAVSPGSVHSNAFLTNFSLMYVNDDFIGERLMPVVPVDKRSDDYATYTKRDRLNTPDDTIGPRGTVNEVSESRGSDNYSVRDYALQNFVSGETLANEDPVFDEMMDLLDAVLAGMSLRREMRLATKLTTAANYAGNTTTLSGANQWNSASGGDPIKNIQDGIAALWGGTGQTDIVGFTNLDGYNTLTRHPAILDLLKYTEKGLATKQQLASIFGLSDILVGAARQDTANIGQTAAYTRIWGDDFGIVRVARRPSKRSAHFGSTFRLKGDPITTQWFDEKPGKGGGYFGKVGCSEDYKVVAGDAGWLIKDILA